MSTKSEHARRRDRTRQKYAALGAKEVSRILARPRNECETAFALGFRGHRTLPHADPDGPMTGAWLAGLDAAKRHKPTLAAWARPGATLMVRLDTRCQVVRLHHHRRDGRLAVQRRKAGRWLATTTAIDARDVVAIKEDPTMKTYSSKSNAKRAAHKALGAEAQEGRDFTLSPTDDGTWIWGPITKEATAAAAADAGGDETAAGKDAGRGDKGRSKKAAGDGAGEAESAPQRRPRGRGEATEKALALLRRPEGATVAELQEATGWLAHTARARISNFGKKEGIKVDAQKEEGRGRVYRASA